MKLNYKKLVMLVGITLVSSRLHMLFAKHVTVKSEKRFDRALDNNKFAVVMLFEEDKQMRKDREYKNKVNELKRMFKGASKLNTYRKGDVEFVAVNVKKKNLQDVADNFGVTQLPTFLLFKNGVPVRGGVKGVVQLNGFISEKQLQEFIDKYLLESIEENIKEIAERRREAREYYYYNRPYYSGYYGYPYWGYYGSPYWGWGHHGYYGRRYYGGFGFGFGW